MLRNTLTGLAVAAAAVTYALPASATDSFTTRIEPRPFYGASVTIEEGVRVFRPLPRQRQVIVNPGGQTPLHLGFEDTRITEYSRSDNYYYDRTPQYYGGRGSYGAPLYYGGRRFGGKHPRRFRKGPRVGPYHPR